jgi:hypothetical protein
LLLGVALLETVAVIAWRLATVSLWAAFVFAAITTVTVLYSWATM